MFSVNPRGKSGPHNIHFLPWPRRQSAMALPPPCSGMGGRLTNRREQTCMQGSASMDQQLSRYLDTTGWAMAQCRVGTCFIEHIKQQKTSLCYFFSLIIIAEQFWYIISFFCIKSFKPSFNRYIYMSFSDLVFVWVSW